MAATQRSNALAMYSAVCRVCGSRSSTSTLMCSGRPPTKSSAFWAADKLREWHSTALKRSA